MKEILNSVLITVKSPKVIPIVTEVVERNGAILRTPSNDFIELKPHQLKRNLVKFLEDAGLTFEYSKVERRRGKVEIDGVIVKVSPINHVNYDKGAFIKVPEIDDLNLDNTRRVLKYLRKHGVDIDKECQIAQKGTSCMLKLNGD